MAEALRRLGFDVLDGRDLDKRSMERLIRQFGIKLAGADVALFFYAGHGLQVEGQNYLVPTDAKLTAEGDVDFEGLAVNLVIKQMERDAKTSLILLDACRDNPLARSLSATWALVARSVGQGFAEVRTGIGTLIGFSTQPGAFALDGTGRNSPYTEALLKYVETPGKDFSGVLVEVRNDVLKATGGRQVPWEHTSLTGQVYLKGQPVLASAEPAQTASLPEPPKLSSAPSGNDKDLEILFWNSVKDSKSPAVLEAYLERYPAGTFTGLARIMIANLKEQAKPSTRSRPRACRPMPDTKQPPQTAGSQPRSRAYRSPRPDLNRRLDPQALTRALQSELKRVGCDPGPVMGNGAPRPRRRLAILPATPRCRCRPGEPSAAALEALASRKGRVCPLECDSGEKEVNGKCVAQAKPAKKTATKQARTRERDDPPPRRCGAPIGGAVAGRRHHHRHRPPRRHRHRLLTRRR